MPRSLYGLEPVEYVAEYFAGCVLMPKRWVVAAFCDGIQRPRDLAELFNVSVRAMEVRLDQLSLSVDPATSRRTPRYRLQPRTTSRLRRPDNWKWRATADQHSPQYVTEESAV
jgi:Zn-dependent peptidase ImmA (M78 family)